MRMQRLQEADLVWRCQALFGIQKLHLLEPHPGKPFVAVEEHHHHHPHKTEANGAASGNVLIYRITNYWWFSLFWFGSQLGDEAYYAIFFSFWFWNIDGCVGRRVVLVWNLAMYTGQALKDVIRWPRPCMPPVVKLESKWAQEYGMPSTHAIVGSAMPFSILYYTYGRYQYPFLLWLVLAVMWCGLVCCSRIYLGMHSVADIVGGLVVSVLMLMLVLPLADMADHFLLSHPLAPLLTTSLSLMAILLYPKCDRWTPARGDTTIIVASYLGMQMGAWTNYQLGVLKGPAMAPPYPILWPSLEQYVNTVLRMAIGGVIIIATRALLKWCSYMVVCFVLKQPHRPTNPMTNSRQVLVELSHKFVTYVAIGFNIIFLAPLVFRTMGIERPTFHTEI